MDKLSWINRLKLCFVVMFKGKYNSKDYKSRRQEEQWKICRQREAEIDAYTRPRTEFSYKFDDLEQ